MNDLEYIKQFDITIQEKYLQYKRIDKKKAKKFLQQRRLHWETKEYNAWKTKMPINIEDV